MMLRRIYILLAVCWAFGGVVGAETTYQPDCLEAIGVRQLSDFEPELRGANVRVGLIELCQEGPTDQRGQAFLPNFYHQSLRSARHRGLFYYQNPYRPAQYSGHASMIAGLLVGDDPNAGYAGLGSFYYRGIVPAAQLDVFETNWFIYQCILSPSAQEVQADVLSISWGTTASDSLTMAWQRGIDALVERAGCVVAAGCGNGGSETPGINKPSWGNNVISVGTARGLGEFADNLRYVGPPSGAYSSLGPTDDGRAKPDVLAAGLCLGPDAITDNGYCRDAQAVGYSSFAAPQVAGVAALLIDAARENQISRGDDPRLIKALILNGANKLAGWHKGKCDPNDDAYFPLDYRQGAGLVNAWNSYRQLCAGRYDPNSVNDPNSGRINAGWDLDEIAVNPADPNSVRIYEMKSELGAGDVFKATLTWYRRYQSKGMFAALPQVRLILELWSLDAQGRLGRKLDGSASEADNLQHIYYRGEEGIRIALVVRGGGSAEEQATRKVTYALAYSGVDGNWSGDQWSADFNADGIVDVADLLQFIQAWRRYREEPAWAQLALEEPYLAEDLNGDGQVNTKDFDIFSQQWQKRSCWYRQL